MRRHLADRYVRHQLWLELWTVSILATISGWLALWPAAALVLPGMRGVLRRAPGNARAALRQMLRSTPSQ